MQSTTKIKVRSYHIDHFGLVNHDCHLEFLEEARWQYLEENQPTISLVPVIKTGRRCGSYLGLCYQKGKLFSFLLARCVELLHRKSI